MLWLVEKNQDERKTSLFRGSKYLILLGLILLAASGALAELTGKIAGKVTDAQTGAGLPGANVIVVRTELGAATEMDGSFTIINVPVGTYILQASMIGYKRSKAMYLRISHGQTTTQDFKLENLIGRPGPDLSDVEPEPPQIESSQLKATYITAHLEQAIEAGRNLIYCSTMQIAWNELEDKIIKERIKLEGDPPIVQALNKRLTTKEDLSEDCYIATVELLSNEFLQRLNKTLKGKFGKQAPPEVNESFPPGPPRFMAYAYLFKNLQFPKPFELLPDFLRFPSGGREDDAIAIGINKYRDEEKYREMSKQVKVVKYLDDNHFIIELKSKSENDQIILAKIKPRKTLLQTIEEVVQTTGVGNPAQPQLKEGETLRIPVLDFNVNHTFTELSGKRFANKGKEDWRIDKAVQWTRFRLNQKGALLKSEAILIVVTAPRTPPKYVPPRLFIFDKPFLICLKQKGAKYPYFAMWVGNTELMVKAK